MKRLALVVGILWAILAASACSRSVMPKGFERLSPGVTADVLLDHLQSDKRLADKVNYKFLVTPLKGIEGKCTGLADEVRKCVEGYRQRAKEAKQKLSAAGELAVREAKTQQAAIAARLGSMTSDRSEWSVEQVGSFDKIVFEIEGASADEKTPPRVEAVTFEMKNGDEAAYVDLKRQAVEKFGEQCKEANRSDDDFPTYTYCDFTLCKYKAEYSIKRKGYKRETPSIEIRIRSLAQSDACSEVGEREKPRL